MDFSVNVNLPLSGAGAADQPVNPNSTAEEGGVSAGSAAADVTMEGIEENALTVTGEGMDGVDNTGAVEAPKELQPTKLAFVDHLKSPIIMLLVGPPDQQITLSAHQLFLSRSPYFQNIFASSAVQTVALVDEDLDAVGCFLQFLYTGEYFPRIIKGPTGEEYLEKEETIAPRAESSVPNDIDEAGDQLLKHAKVYTLAEKLGMPELKTLAHAKIHRINSTAKGELAYARFVYGNTPREDTTIRHPIATFWAHRSHILRHEAEDEFRRMVLEFPQFAYDILSMVLDQKEKGKEREAEKEAHHGGVERSKSGRKRPRLSTLA